MYNTFNPSDTVSLWLVSEIGGHTVLCSFGKQLRKVCTVLVSSHSY